jgi:hypothetical protein
MPADVDALNYPYIRVHSADWLKRTLLISWPVSRTSIVTPSSKLGPISSPRPPDMIRTTKTLTRQ